ncbi:MAG: MerR family transcriptional regulator [Deltaproteobacteria bacterium]|jgi:DNA-binding transcriptional MerR regulator|nr:MerR family transcriptional regulator [Deltaproteobacteria bacterium]
MYSIGKLAELSGVRPVTIRYYEKVGVMGSPERRENGYRCYSEGDLSRLAFIRHCRSHDLSIDDIKELLALSEAPESNCGAVNEIIDKQIGRLDELGKSIESLKSHLVDLRHRCSGAGPVAQCEIMKGLLAEDAPNAALCPMPKAKAPGKGKGG